MESKGEGVLITGGAGFIGSHIVDRLTNENMRVAIIDNLSTGSQHNINPKTAFYKADINDKKALESVFRDANPEYVVHAAANIKVRESIKNPVHDAKVNIIGGLNILECSRKFKVNKIVYLCSGGAIYGNPKYLPVDENHPIEPISPYGISKWCLELYMQSYFVSYNLNFISLRLSNVYGSRDYVASDHVIPVFIHCLLNNKAPVISGDGSQGRDFIYIDDAVDAVMLALKRDTKERFFNIGTEKLITIKELFNEIQCSLKSNVKAQYKENTKGEVKKIYLSIKKAKKYLGWKPKTGLRQGLLQTIKWFKEK